ncbi:MAG: NTE family protein [Glaciecola sp.]|jgi:NTE family protein|uniref:patatin-like phospholipase family protein n=1 Tax=Congregibacter sp. TaxID=2744308 RepID=UPI0039E44FA6
MKNALILSGGGARAAYQVGVLKAVAELLPEGATNPFPIICGTSAGAINAVTLAAYDGSFAHAVETLESVWMDLTPEQVYRCGWGAIARSAGRLMLSLVNRGVGVGKPVALLDNSPLRGLIKRTINFEKIDRGIARGDLDAVCVTATGYHSGRSMCFYQAKAGIEEWTRYRRSGRRALLNTDHLMASSAIPTMFPATRIEFEYFGDGAVRQLAPLSPALHLGADRLFIVGVSANRERPQSAVPARPSHSPSMAQIIGHLLNSAFIDSLESDIERLDRINKLVELVPKESLEQGSSLRYIDRQVISPSEELDMIAADNTASLPPSVRFLLRATGGTESGAGSTAASYLLFARPFVETLIALGYRDAMWQQADIAGFLGVDSRV